MNSKASLFAEWRNGAEMERDSEERLAGTPSERVTSETLLESILLSVSMDEGEEVDVCTI